MGELFDFNYPQEKNRVKKSLAKLLTSKKIPCSITLESDSKKIPEIVAINYAFENGDTSPYRRALEFENKSYFIIPEDKVIIAKDRDKFRGNFFYDADKIPIQNRYSFNGTFEEILREFNFEGYRLID